MKMEKNCQKNKHFVSVWGFTKLMCLKFIYLTHQLLKKIKRMLNKHKANQDLKVQGQKHLKGWVDYITEPLPSEREVWHEHNSYEHVKLSEDYVDFIYLNRKYRLAWALHFFFDF